MGGPKKTTGSGPVLSSVAVQFGAFRADLEQSGLVWSRVRFGPDPWITPRWRTSSECLGVLKPLEQLHTLTLSIQKVLGFLDLPLRIHVFDRWRVRLNGK